jgi:predicted porin
MKKSLFAIAAVTAFAGAAQAQSSVTVYGILDAGYAGGNQRIAGASSVSKATFSQFQASGAESTNRIGFRGTEDLGGGTAANFVFETNVNANAASWTPEIRQAWAGLSQKGIGAARIGTQNTLIWQLAAPMTVGQLNNVSGSVVNATNVGAPLTDGANGATASAFTNRSQRTLQVDSERMSGFQAKAMYVLNNVNSNQTTSATGYTGGTNNFNGWGASLDFTGVPKLRVAAAYQSFNGENPYSTTNTLSTAAYTAGTPAACNTGAFSFAPQAAATNLTSAAASACTNVRDTQVYAAAMYDFGILTAYVNYVNRKVESQYNSNLALTRTAQEIGVRSFITPKIEGWASAGNGRWTALGNANPTANITGYQLGSNYWLSKRTNLYAIYGQVGTSSTSIGAANTNNYAVGARHTF